MSVPPPNESGIDPINDALRLTQTILSSLMAADHPSAENLTRAVDAVNALSAFLVALRGLREAAHA